jgi:hypothetical protein
MPAASTGYDARLTNGDLTTTSGVVYGVDFSLQRLSRRIQTHLGECLVDRNAGIDWLAWFQVMPPDMALMTGLIREQIDTCPGIARTQTLDGAFDPSTRIARWTGQVTLTDGQTAAITLDMGGVNGNPALLALLLQPAGMFA